ncbi:hypothetical protein [Limnospira sp. PMC 1042.18]|uniref:hypothetical protein n=1 Tax=Limnospira sp. PMC 1042.18 TaxID=2981018 RepID=UPI0028E1196B|nr:hypothetical protein [Limnospira sp. PMC 1042.18]MDT9199235.1 hypothetical protein [Limnospira sp. PMC 1042.18]
MTSLTTQDVTPLPGLASVVDDALMSLFSPSDPAHQSVYLPVLTLLLAKIAIQSDT